MVVKETTASKPAVTSPPSPNLNPIKKGKGKSVNFSWSKSTSLASSTSTLTVIQGQTTSTTLVPEMVDLTLPATSGMMPGKLNTLPQNLCDTLRRVKKQQVEKCCGYIVDSLSTKRRVYGYPIEEAADSEKWSTVTLRQVLECPTGELPPLTYHDRLYLAAVISSSVLQLQQTPWLPDKLRSEDVVFVQRQNVSLYEHAFVAKRVPERENTTAGWPMKASIRHNPTMLSWVSCLLSSSSGDLCTERVRQTSLNPTFCPTLCRRPEDFERSVSVGRSKLRKRRSGGV